MVTTLENKRVGYIDKSEAAQLAIEMDNENKELAVKGFKLTPLARIVDCCDIHKLRVRVVAMNNARRHNEQLAAVVAPSPADSNKYCSTVGVREDGRRVQVLEKIAAVYKTRSKKWSNIELSQVEKEVGAEALVMIKKGNLM